MAPPDFRADINGLRGLNVMLVVAYHLQLRGAGGGFIGVDVFFVVSGYLMTRVLMHEEAASVRAYAAFVLARARRIWPALAALVAVLLLVGAAVLPPFDLLALARQALTALAFVSNHHYLAHSGHADRTADDLWLLHTWSLSVEWQFYLLYPLLVFAALVASRRPGLAVPRVLLPLLTVLAAVSLGWQASQRGLLLERGFFLFAARAWELLAGGMVAAATGARGVAQPPRRWTCTAGVLVILGSALALAWLRLPRGPGLGAAGPRAGGLPRAGSCRRGEPSAWAALAASGRALVVFDLPVALAAAGRLAPGTGARRAMRARVVVRDRGIAGGPPVPHFERLQPGFDCCRYAARAWQDALSPRYDTVVVSARWATVALAGPPYCYEALAGRCEAVAPARKPALVAAELSAAIERTLRAGKTVVLLDSAPEAHVRVAKRLAREQFWYGAPRLWIDRAALHADTAWLDPALEALRGRPGFRQVSLRDTLCDERRCRVYDDTLRRSIYTDESHFDPVWIAENARLFEPFAQRERPTIQLSP